MKKTLAAVGASALGLAMVGAGAAAPAAAVDTTEPCADLQAQYEATGNVTDNWYQDCVPQYGIGKAEFAIVADETDPTVEFPEGFVPLDEIPVEQITTTTTGDLPAVQAYYSTFFGGDPLPALITPNEGDLDDPTTQVYSASVVAPVTSINAVDDEGDVPDSVAAACDVETVEYFGAWWATFGAVDTTFSQTVAGEAWDYTITATPLPTFFFVGPEGPTGTWCISDGTHTIDSGDPSGAPGEVLFAFVPHSPSDGGPDSPIFDLGTFARNAPAVSPAVTPQLAATGVDATPLVVAAGAFTAFGLALLGFTTIAGRRRRVQS